MLDERRIATSPRADIFARTYRLPEGTLRPDYLVVAERSGTLVVAVTEADEVLLVRQYRPPVESYLWELPAGALERGEADPQAGARTELEQETGYTAAAWHSLGTFHAAPHRSTETDHGFLALGATRVGKQDLDPGESVRYKLVPLRTLEDMMDAGEIRSAPSLVVLFKALRLLAELRT
jgi:8-oxo-dGTP pyrophosphatase MutT (NUDIX family)